MRYWLPVILWITVIFAASSDLFSAPHTGSVLEEVITTVLGYRLSPAAFEKLHFIVRKCAHLTEYGILGALLFRAIRGHRTRWHWRWAGAAVGIAGCVASVDEWRQTFVPSRTGSPIDVAIDIAGAAVAQIVIRAMQVLFF